MRRPTRILPALPTAIALTLFPQAAMAEGHNSQATLGSTGTDVVIAECPAGEVLTGFTGRTGAGIDRIQILCASVLADGSYGAPHPFADSYGGFGGGPAPANSCDQNSRISLGFVALVPDNKMVATAGAVCIDRAGNPVKRIAFGDSSIFREDMNTADYGFIGVSRRGATAQYSCPNESFVGVRIRFDTAVRGLGFLCDTRTPPPPPVKPIKNTRKPKPTSAAASGPPLAPRASITGAWKLVANGSEHYNLLLTAQGDGMMIGQDNLPFAVVGNLTSPDASPDMGGTFSANMLPTRQLQGGYGQKNGVSGQCLLNYSADGQLLVGDCSRGNDSVKWSATRGSWPAETAAAPRLDRGALHAVEVKLTVDVYEAAGGDGRSTGQLRAGTPDVELVQACQDNWCHVRWPGHEGWVYSGPDYNSLGQ